jgi:signal transduction histidine kinase
MRSTIGFTLSLRRLLVLLSGIGLLPLALLGLWSLHTASQHQQREQNRAMLDQARALSSAVDAELDGSIATLASLARAPSMGAGDLHAFYDIARNQVAAQPEWLAIILTDAAGKVLLRTTDPFGAAAARITEPESLRQLLAVQRPVVGHVVRGQNGKVAFPMRVPIRDEAGRLYALTAVIEPDRILAVVKRQGVPEGSLISVIDAFGSIVARSKDHDERVAGPPGTSLAKLLRSAAPEGVGDTVDLEGHKMATAFTRVSRYGWTVAVSVPQRTVGAAALTGITLYGWGLAASLLACIVLASLLSARIARSFANLERAAAALGAGDKVEVAPSRIREVALMGQALETAAAQHATHEAERSCLLASLEQALAASRDASLVKDEFLAVLGHELRNPLSPIVASLDLMDLRADGANLRERTIMRRQVNHLKRLVDDLLDVSRITSGKMQLELRPLNLADVVYHAATSRPDRPVELTVPDMLWVQGDESRLAQVLNNLLSNAERFGKGATRVVLRAEGQTARLEVSDDGIGMGPELLARVFEPFYQAPQQVARITGGLGLGLAIVRKIVELHGGRVWAHSDGPGTGSRFVVELPRVAHTAAAALELCARYRPAVVILDIGLPDMDGYALAAAIRRTGAAPRLVALTGYGQKADVERAADAGFDLHLTKPASLEDLERAVSGSAELGQLVTP